ncbi:MAG: gliding motility-associated protein GldE [Sediminibacterium sp.]|uniref:gliding motility-associated protein GldE n=1 Tax=Sediminibacterium sp. TaxID=1917865 RepID=UPI002AB931F6|nr:gliding motility-associated protein GldE [Sediminibacterium sp.]MDZ4072055.1 gliding motility-associated protein GldE [Sediminibacterium sp.]
MDYHSVLYTQLLSAIHPQGTTVLVMILVVLLFLSFVLSGSEVAFFSLTYKDINNLKSKQIPSYKRIVDLLEQPKTLLASLLIANSFINISIIIISNLLIDNMFNFEQFNAVWVEFLIKVLAVSFLLVLFGEVMPKVLATQNNIRFAKDFGAVVQAVAYTFAGMSKWLVKYSDIIEKKLASKTGSAYSLEELDHAIDLTTNETASENEKNILKGIVKFSNISVKQIMKTRMDVHGVEYGTSFGELITLVKELNYSRLPVYKEDLDEVLGMIHTKDLLPYLHEHNDYNWHPLMRPPFFVHEQKPIEDLLQEFQQKRIHFAVVVDEFGGTSGIVTLEDILEEVIGEIKDEFDEEDTVFKKIDDNNYVFEGRTMIHDACKIMDIPAETFDEIKGESDSLAGLVLEIAGDIPKTGAILHSGDFEFTVLELEKNRIQKIKLMIKREGISL